MLSYLLGERYAKNQSIKAIPQTIPKKYWTWHCTITRKCTHAHKNKDIYAIQSTVICCCLLNEAKVLQKIQTVDDIAWRILIQYFELWWNPGY